MSGIKEKANFVRRGNFNGHLYDVDHLATFTVGTKSGLLKAEDGMRKLRVMEKSQGIWTMECQILIDTNFLVVFDKKNSQIVEIFPLHLVVDPTSVISDDKKDVYNNIILFTVIDEAIKNYNSNNQQSSNLKSGSIPSEMHIFQCIKANSTEIVDEVYRAKEASSHIDDNINLRKQLNRFGTNSEPSSNLKRSNQNALQSSQQSNNLSNMETVVNRIDMEVQILNHCFDDIERFVTRLQNSTDYLKQMEKKNQQKTQKDNCMIRSPMPSSQHLVDIFQKFKFSFNLLSKLKAHIHDPNAPELIHFLFTPLSLIVNATKEQPYRGLAKTIWQPLITVETKELLLNCLTSKEQDLWLSLGEAWTITSDDVKMQPQLYSHLESIQNFMPVFYDGWSPNYNVNVQIDDVNTNNINNDISRLAFATAAQVQAKSQNQANNTQNKNQIVKSRLYSNTQPQLEGEVEQRQSLSNTSNNINKPRNLVTINKVANETPPPNSNGIANANMQNKNQNQSLRNYDEMKKWATDLQYRGAKVYEVTHDRQANNDKELTVKMNELVEVLDDKRNWWRLRNFYGIIGHAPVTILREFNQNIVANTNNNNNNNNNNINQFQSLSSNNIVLNSNMNIDVMHQTESNQNKVGYF